MIRALLAAVGVALLAGCRLLEPPAATPPAADFVLTGVAFESYDEGRETSSGTLARARYAREGARATFDDVALSTDGGRLRSDLADTDLHRRVADLSGHVRWLSAGDALSTERCEISLATHAVVGRDPVTVDGDGYRATADGFSGRYGRNAALTLAGHVHALLSGAAK